MGQTINHIETHIEHVREDLGSNIHELERKVKSVADWKQHFQSSPMTMLGVAFGGGILAAMVLGGRKRTRGGNRRSSHEEGGSELHEGTAPRKERALQTWDNIKGALVGVVAERFKGFVDEIVPEFAAQYRRTEAKTGQ